MVIGRRWVPVVSGRKCEAAEIQEQEKITGTIRCLWGLMRQDLCRLFY